MLNFKGKEIAINFFAIATYVKKMSPEIEKLFSPSIAFRTLFHRFVL